MASPALDTPTMNRLAFIRMLYQQGIEQARRPEPLSFASLLSFHDSVELFLVLAADHLGARLSRRDPNFLDYWQILRPTETFPAGVELSGQPGLDRLNRYHNALKHVGAFPGREAVEDALTTTTSFFPKQAPYPADRANGPWVRFGGPTQTGRLYRRRPRHPLDRTPLTRQARGMGSVHQYAPGAADWPGL